MRAPIVVLVFALAALGVPRFATAQGAATVAAWRLCVEITAGDRDRHLAVDAHGEVHDGATTRALRRARPASAPWRLGPGGEAAVRRTLFEGDLAADERVVLALVLRHGVDGPAPAGITSVHVELADGRLHASTGAPGHRVRVIDDHTLQISSDDRHAPTLTLVLEPARRPASVERQEIGRVALRCAAPSVRVDGRGGAVYVARGERREVFVPAVRASWRCGSAARTVAVPRGTAVVFVLRPSAGDELVWRFVAEQPPRPALTR